MRSYELECTHGVGHSPATHGCDGCCEALIMKGRDQELDRIIGLIHETYNNEDLEEWGSFVFSEDIIELITGANK